MNSNDSAKSDILSAKREVERAKRELAVQLRTASRSSKQMIERTLSQTKPILTGIAALGAAAAAIAFYKLARGRPRRKGWLVPPQQPSMLGNMARAALTSAAASLAGYLMERLQHTLDTHNGARVGLPADGAQRSAVR